MTTAFELPIGFVFDDVANQQLIDVATSIPGVDASGVDVSNKTRDDLELPTETGVTRRMLRAKRKLQAKQMTSD